MSQPVLRPQDAVILAKLLTYGGRRPPLAHVAADLSISASEVHAGLKRLACSRLVATPDRPVLEAVEEFFVHAVKYVFPARRGEVTRGLPTSYAAPPLDRQITSGSELPPVWPFPEGDRRGLALEPLYRTVPAAALKDSNLYELLALLDAVRAGRARERRLAVKALALKVRHPHA